MVKQLKFENGLNMDVKVYSDVGNTGRKGIGKNGESHVPKRQSANTFGELDIVNYNQDKDVKLSIVMTEIPNDGKTIGFSYGFGSNINRIPHDIQLIKKGDVVELTIHYSDSHHKTHIDPQIKHPEGEF
ncbi:MAG: hypothetical protein WC967_06760 [Balneolaceae bacterium]